MLSLKQSQNSISTEPIQEPSLLFHLSPLLSAYTHSAVIQQLSSLVSFDHTEGKSVFLKQIGKRARSLNNQKNDFQQISQRSLDEQLVLNLSSWKIDKVHMTFKDIEYKPKSQASAFFTPNRKSILVGNNHQTLVPDLQRRCRSRDLCKRKLSRPKDWIDGNLQRSRQQIIKRVRKEVPWQFMAMLKDQLREQNWRASVERKWQLYEENSMIYRLSKNNKKGKNY